MTTHQFKGYPALDNSVHLFNLNSQFFIVKFQQKNIFKNVNIF